MPNGPNYLFPESRSGGLQTAVLGACGLKTAPPRAEKLGNCFGDVTLRLAGQFRIYRQRQRFSRSAFGLGKISRPVTEVGEALLLVQSERIIDGRADFLPR